MVTMRHWSCWRKPSPTRNLSKNHFLLLCLFRFSIRRFSDVTETIRETSIVMLISLTFVFLLIAAVIIPSVINRGNLLNPVFILGLIIFGVMGFMAFEIISRFDFLGGGFKFGIAGIILLLLVGAATGGKHVVAFVSGSISGAALFYLKSIYSIYFIVKTETRKTAEVLTVSEMDSIGEVNHFVVDGFGSNFELIYHMVEEISEGKEILSATSASSAVSLTKD